MITFLIQMIELPNSGQMTTCRIQFDSRDKIWLVASWTETMMSLLKNVFILRRPRLANFADIIIIETMSITTIFNNLQKLIY